MQFDLYGINYDRSLANYSNISYHGSFLSNDIPKELDYGFGLVWDGNSIETCSGPTGEYLKINNPHKLSLYLLSGIPVIIWDQAAEAKYVQKMGIGLCVKSLIEIEPLLDSISEKEYFKMVSNVKKCKRNLRRGIILQKPCKNHFLY